MVARADRQLRNVLIAVDLSAASEQLVRRVTLLPLAADAALELLHVLPDGMPKKAASAAAQRSEEKLGQLQRLARGTSEAPTITFKTVTGQPYVEVIRRSREIDADLVVLGREGRKRLQDRLTIGSTPKRVIRKGDVPVLVVAFDPSGPYQRPVVAVDLSDTSRRIIDLSRRILGPEGERGVLVHAYYIPFEGWLRENGLGGEFKEKAAQELERFHAKLGEDARRWRPILRKGDPRVIVLAEAARRRADLIVLGTHGRSGVSHALIGSVAEFVVEEATCDVAITRPMRYSFELP